MNDNSVKEIDEYLCTLRKSGSVDPNKTPKYSYSAWVHYYCRFCIDYPLIILFEVTCLLLSIYGTLKAMYAAYHKNHNDHNNNCQSLETQLIFDSNDAKSANDNDNVQPKKAFLSIIIGCYNESDNIEQLLLYLEKFCSDKENTEIILVDGGSTDDWWSKLPKHNEKLAKLITIKIKLIKYGQHKQSGRGICQSIGVEHCDKKTDLLLFLHADTIVCNGFDEMIRNNLSNKNKIVCGAFRFGLDCNDMIYPMVGFCALQLRVALDTYLCWLPFGDQGIFVSLKMYKKLGGIPKQCIMEDFEFMKRARNYAFENNMKIKIENNKIYTSPRKYYKSKRIWKNTIINQLVIYLYEHKGYSPEQVYQVYYNKPLPQS